MSWSAGKAGCLPAFFLKAHRVKGMLEKEILDRVRVIVDPVLLDEKLELVDLEYRRESRGWVLRLYLDKEGGVTLDDCTRVSQEVGRILDVEDFIQTPYTLEVSSPGLSRRLKNEKDFMRYRGYLIKVKTVDPIENRRHFKGKLLGISENQLEIETDGEIFRISLSDVAKANLEMDRDVFPKGHRK
jgi:ribosome maturation factor RimP